MEPTVEQLKAELKSANKAIEILHRDIMEFMRVERLIVEAGLLSEEKFEQARELINKDV